MTNLQYAAARQGDGSSTQKNNRYYIVVDTSTLISAIFFGNGMDKTLLHIANHQHMILSDYIIEEFLEFAENTSPKISRRALRLMRQTLEKYTTDYEVHKVQMRDINDVPIMQLAIEYGALVVTGDKDLLEYKGDAKVEILSIAEYNKILLD